MLGEALCLNIYPSNPYRLREDKISETALERTSVTVV